MNIKRVLIVAQAATLMSWGAFAVSVSATSWADDSKPGEVHTRSIDDIHADLMRDWHAKPSGTYGHNVHTRSAEDAKSDLTRDWSAKASGTYGPDANSRSIEQAAADLNRADFFGGKMPLSSSTLAVAGR